jgi:hypothetical protein
MAFSSDRAPVLGDDSNKWVPGFHAVTRGRGGEGGSRGLKNIFYRGHILCILVHLEIELSHLE